MHEVLMIAPAANPPTDTHINADGINPFDFDPAHLEQEVAAGILTISSGGLARLALARNRHHMLRK